MIVHRQRRPLHAHHEHLFAIRPLPVCRWQHLGPSSCRCQSASARCPRKLLLEYTGRRHRRRGAGPPGIEKSVALTSGHFLQGDCLPQYMRSNLLNAETPMRGVYLCGAGTHPGGSVIAINGPERGDSGATSVLLSPHFWVVTQGNFRPTDQ
jgi:hypothetical protein